MSKKTTRREIFVGYILVPSFFLLISYLGINEGYFSSDVDRVKEGIHPYNFPVAIVFLVVSLTVLFYRHRRRVYQSANEKSDFVIRAGFFLTISFLALLLQFDFFITNISLPVNKIRVEGFVYRVYEISSYDSINRQLIVLDNDFAKVGFTPAAPIYTAKTGSVILRFRKGLLDIPFHPKVLFLLPQSPSVAPASEPSS